MMPTQLWFKFRDVLIFGVVAFVAVAVSSVGGRAAADKARKLVVFGDSLVAGYGVAANRAFPAQLEAALRAKGHKVAVINAGVSGDTTAAGLARFDWAIPPDASAVIVELGANDALRGLPPKLARDNLGTILSRLKARGLPVLLAGMRAPRNWGNDYATAFDAMYPALAKVHGVELYPFFLEGIALVDKFNQRDGMHPNENGVAEIVRRVLPAVERLLARVK